MTTTPTGSWAHTTATAASSPSRAAGSTAVCALIAIPVDMWASPIGGVGSTGTSAGVALAGILTGWLMLFACLFALLAFVGLVAGLTVLVDHA
ncbi:hypothetical protein [Streptomyces sp. NPDC002845]